MTCEDALFEAFARGTRAVKHLTLTGQRKAFEAGWLASYLRGGAVDIQIGKYLMERDWQAYCTVGRIPSEDDELDSPNVGK